MRLAASADAIAGKLAPTVTVSLWSLSVFAPFSRTPVHFFIAAPPISGPSCNGPYLARAKLINDMAFCF